MLEETRGLDGSLECLVPVIVILVVAAVNDACRDNDDVDES